MCGIAGFNWEDKSLIKKMTRCIQHRGPDDEGFYTDKNVSLGHRRLSIIDLSRKGHQPMSDTQGKIIVVYNGEIYNFKSLKETLQKRGHKFNSNSDTEVIVNGYKEYGNKIFSMLDGMFAIAIWDVKNKELILARDRIGKKPIYYYYKNGKIIFASEMKAILEHKLALSINKDSLKDFFNLRFFPENKTLYSEIQKLKPGHYLVFKAGKIKIDDFWSLPVQSNNLIPSIKEVDKLIDDAVKKRLIADVPIGVFLSGGLDSSTIVSYMSRSVDKFKTFSIGFEDNTNESKYANLVSQNFGTDHKEIILDTDILKSLPKVIWHLDQPLADPACLPTYVLCKHVSKNVKVALSGEGGDEVFGGYQTFNYIDKIKRINKVPFVFRAGAASVMSASSALFKYPRRQILKVGSEIFMQDNIKDMHKKLFYLPFDEKESSNLTKSKSNKGILDKYLVNDLHKSAIDFYFNEWLPNDLLVKADKMSMAHGLEVRVPFLDIDLINYFYKVRTQYKKDRDIFRRVIANKIPKQILSRKKQGFTLPISNWINDRDYLNRVIPHITDLRKRKILDEEMIDEIVKNPTGFRNDHRIWSLLVFELWSKQYIDATKFDKIRI